jgi:hypothetical protein
MTIHIHCIECYFCDVPHNAKFTDLRGRYTPQLHLQHFDQSHVVTIRFFSRPGIYNVNSSVAVSFHPVCLAVARQQIVSLFIYGLLIIFSVAQTVYRRLVRR